MEREEKVEKGRKNKKKQEEELLVVKLKQGILVGKRGGNCNCTTPSPTWKIGLAQADGSLLEDLPFSSNSASLSVRKLGADLWEFQPQVNKMSKIGPLHQNHIDKRSKLRSQPADPPHSPPQQPTSTSSLGRDIAASLRQHHHHLLRKNGGAQSLESPASYCSSMEMAPYKPVETPTSSKDFKGRSGKSSYSLKTSTELLKILNRIWSLEQQHSSNMSLVKALRKDLDYSQRRVKELQEEKKRDREEIDDLMMLVAEYRIGRKNKHNRTEDAVKTLTVELHDERKLRKHTENLHRKLAREIAEVKSSFSNALKELEREREARIMLEELCDEFANGTKEYEQEVRFLKSKQTKDHTLTEEKDGLIIHICEAWLDERMQMKQAQSHHGLAEKKTTVDKLKSEIQTFLKARHSSDNKNNVSNLKGAKESCLHRHSLESFHLNNIASAPRIENEDGDSFANTIRASKSNRGSGGKHNDSSCINQHEKSITESHPPQKKIGTPVSKDPDATSSRIQPEEKIFESTVVKETPVEGNDSPVLEKSVTKQRKSQKRKNNRMKTGSSLLNNLLRDHSLPSEAKTLENDDKHMEHSFDPTTFTGPTSPVQKWTSKLTAPDLEVVESSSKLTLGVKENTLKAKLLEARLERQLLQPRATKGLSEVS